MQTLIFSKNQRIILFVKSQSFNPVNNLLVSAIKWWNLVQNHLIIFSFCSWHNVCCWNVILSANQIMFYFVQIICFVSFSKQIMKFGVSSFSFRQLLNLKVNLIVLSILVPEHSMLSWITCTAPPLRRPTQSEATIQINKNFELLNFRKRSKIGI